MDFKSDHFPTSGLIDLNILTIRVPSPFSWSVNSSHATSKAFGVNSSFGPNEFRIVHNN
jgi:hypothetical protein